MQRAFFGLLIAVLVLASAQAYAAECPNLNAHPGITTIYLQSDFGEKDAATKIYVSGLEDAIKKSNAFCPVQDLPGAA